MINEKNIDEQTREAYSATADRLTAVECTRTSGIADISLDNFETNMRDAIAKGANNHEKQYNAETVAAMREAEMLANGTLETKYYSSFNEFIADIEAEG